MIAAMRRELMDILACPVCKGPLTLEVQLETDDEILSGTLRCEACDHNYSIADGIPDLLPSELASSGSGDAAGEDVGNEK